MTKIKCKFGVKAFVSTVLIVVLFSFVLSPVTLVNVASAVETEEDANLFVGYSDDAIDIHEATRLSSPSLDAPSLTVLVHGQGGKAYNWSNNNNEIFTYDSSSLIESLRFIAQNADVYLAKVKAITLDEWIPSEDFYLIRLTQNDYNTDQNDYVTKLTDVSKHIIVVFESSIPYSYHRDVYEELHNVIDKLSYDILHLTGKIPKVNLISHSRGGITSMMYATGYREDGKLAHVQYQYSQTHIDGYIDIGDNYYEIPAEYNQNSDIINDHPYNVAELYSMGTPYWGTDWDTMFFGAAHLLLSDEFSKPSAKNILDETIQAEIYSCWEEAVDKNSELKLNAIAGTFDLSFVLGLLAEDYESLSQYLPVVELKYYLELFDKWGGVAIEFIELVESILAMGAGYSFVTKNILGIIPVVLTITVDVVRNIVVNALNNLNEFENTYSDQLQNGTNIGQTVYTELSYILKDFIEALTTVGEFVGQFSGETNLVHDWGDLFIDTNSQLAEGFSNIETYEKLFAYSNIGYSVNATNDVIITYSNRTFAYKKAIEQVAIPHILETRDADIISYICDNIELGIPTAFYEYEVLGDNTLKITGVELPNSYFENSGVTLELNLEGGINGKQISCIGDNAFSDLSNHLANITLPNTITSIEEGAFSGCNNLSINIANGNLYYKAIGNIIYNKTLTKI
ncbi:MAG: leucine-rich repeat protein, partial [Clostridia bacterium]|nr:leucine-rich repeat protein [Clostridia bacterium]